MFCMGILDLTNTGVGYGPATMSTQANGGGWLAESSVEKYTVDNGSTKRLRKKAKKKKSPRKRNDALPSSELGGNDRVYNRTAADPNRHSNVVANEAAANPITDHSIMIQHPVQSLEIAEAKSVENGGGGISHPLARSTQTKIICDDFDEGVVVPRSNVLASSSSAAGKTKANTRKDRKKKKRKKSKDGYAEDNAEVSSAGGGGGDAPGIGDYSGSRKANIKGDSLKEGKRKRKAESSGLGEKDGVDVEKTQDRIFGGIPFALPPSPAGAPTAQSRPAATTNGHAKRAIGSPNTKKAVSGELSNGTIPHSNHVFTNGGFGGACGGDGFKRLPRKHQQQRKTLPIFDHREEIIHAVKKHQTVVLVGETGSGKSTQVPQFLYEAGVTSAVGGGGWRCDENSSTTSNGTTPATGKTTSGDSGTKCRRKAAGLLKRGVIGCTQPRRVAAVTVARRVAAEAGSGLGHLVGYSVRFDDCTTPSTRIKYLTDGILLREAMNDPLLSAYSAIILDEAHERSLETDVLFGLIRRAQPQRPDLRVIVMSATLDVDLFRRFFRDAISLQVPGRTHPVDVMYTREDQDDYLDACLVTCLQIQESEEDGDVLVFLPGQEDIEALAQLLSENLSTLRAERSRELATAAAGALETSDGREFHPSAEAVESCPLKGSGDGFLRPTMVCPVFAALPQEQQLDAFKPAPKGTRKFVLATNIAETSVTINGIRFVVDSGKVKTRSFQPSTGMELLRSQDVSKAQATQRAGRAGREAPGVCYRLFREESYLSLEEAPIPEILRVNLAQVILQLKVMGIENPATFDYVTAPKPSALLAALKKLAMLGALDKEGGVTADGKKMAALPLDPAFAHLVVRSAEPRFGCAKEVLTTVACLSAESLLFYPSKEDVKRAANEAHRAFAAYEGDLPTLLNIYRGFCKERKDPTWCRRNFVNGRALARAVDVRQQLDKISRERLQMDPEESCDAEMSRYLRCLVGGLFTNVATRQPAPVATTNGNGTGRACYRTVIGNREVHIHPSSTLWRRNPPPKSVVFTELLSTTRDFIKTVTAVDALWLGELVPRFFKSSTGVLGTKVVASS